MGIGILYFFVTLIVISVGAIAGISGGVILRPVFDLIGYHDAISIAFYMGVAVLVMSLSSTMKQISMGTKIDFQKVLTLASGSVVGGLVGQLILNHLLAGLNDNFVQILQGIVSILLLIFVIICTRPDVRTHNFRSLFWYSLVGLGLGTIATILAIGGGPINVAAFMILFSITIKEATVYSITTIFFTQIARLTLMGFDPGFGLFDMSILFFIVPAAIMGGVIGGRLNVKLRSTTILKIFKAVVMGTILLNIFNVVSFWMSLSSG